MRNQSAALVSEYTYNGLGYRIGWHYDTNASSATDGSDPWYYFCHDDRWRVVAVFRGSDDTPKERFVYHAAGLGGTGGSSYIDDVSCRDRDYSTDWYGEDSDGVLETRTYFCQNWRHDVSAIVTSGGAMIEWAKYSAYGVPFCMAAGDANSNGLIDVNDLNQVNTWIAAPAYDVRGDLDLDGDLDANDLVALNNTGYPTLGRGVLSRADYSDNRKGYAGYEHAAELAGTQWHVRHRVLDSELGRWTRRDPAGYVDGMGLLAYVSNAPIGAVDSDGRVACLGGGTCINQLPVPIWIIPEDSTVPVQLPPNTGGFCDAIYPVTPGPGRDAFTGCLPGEAFKVMGNNGGSCQATINSLIVGPNGIGTSCCNIKASIGQYKEGGCVPATDFSAPPFPPTFPTPSPVPTYPPPIPEVKPLPPGVPGPRA